jgi:hypothetical protein
MCENPGGVDATNNEFILLRYSETYACVADYQQNFAALNVNPCPCHCPV